MQHEEVITCPITSSIQLSINTVLYLRILLLVLQFLVLNVIVSVEKVTYAPPNKKDVTSQEDKKSHFNICILGLTCSNLSWTVCMYVKQITWQTFQFHLASRIWASLVPRLCSSAQRTAMGIENL